ncbi:hypothetical protein ASC61_02560 [Aeromicrobium sp. Root344]|uniref:hypothetical protein n=1 Tax=Aeromicrobium sp. Root344 TaxID=1736521 RepID=UPI0006F57DB1|nr:hypothetical protein [Aeromicrobium sp. Root344]KQV73976.1 hypothetical protein ASC61_02560 [Aeromicrobium sp. Root344]
MILLSIFLWMTYLTVTWLRTTHPVGAIAPAIIGLSFLLAATRRDGRPSDDRPTMALGLLSALGIAVLWIAAARTDDSGLREQAMGLSIWGGFLVVLAVFVVYRRFRDRPPAGPRSPAPPPGPA